MDHLRRHERRAKSAKRLLIVFFFMLRIPDVAVYYYSFKSPTYGSQARGNLWVISIWTTVFLVAMWLGKKWARYLLIAFTGYIVFAYVVVTFLVLGYRPAVVHPEALVPFVSQAICYACVATIAVRSRSIRSLCSRS